MQEQSCRGLWVKVKRMTRCNMSFALAFSVIEATVKGCATLPRGGLSQWGNAKIWNLTRNCPFLRKC